MKDFHGKTRACEVFERITLQEFKKAYTCISLSTDKVPVASTVFPITDSAGMTTGKYNAIIFFEIPSVPTPLAPVPKKAALTAALTADTLEV